MPARSQAQRIAIAIAEHHPSQLYARNKSLLGMTHQQMHDFASTKTAGLPQYAPLHPRMTGGSRRYTGYQREWDVVKRG